jgi:2-oxoglutarate dehydrogenase E1 component
MVVWNDFNGINAGYVLELYERYQQDPENVDAATRRFFETWQPPQDGFQGGAESGQPAAASTEASTEWAEKVVGTANLAQSIRFYGHLQAQLDPLGTPQPGDPSLAPQFHGISEADLKSLPAEIVGGPAAEKAANAYEAIQALRQVYCRTTGYDYDHIRSPESRSWLRDAAECGRFRPTLSPQDGRSLLERLTQVEGFELFLHRIFPGKTRFSIEGLDMLVPMLDEIVRGAVAEEICMIFLGMAHRGRLNVLAHVMGKAYDQILAEFKDPTALFPTRNELGWTGDVKYHKGAQEAVSSEQEVKLLLRMPPNPSHLEHIDPVVVGMARAADCRVNRPGPPTVYPNASLPILIHGDASFPGQGIVAETLNFSRLPGYHTGGALHIITNNQLGYTATARETRSTLYASDLAKGFKIPVIHVNADDPEACLEAARTAFAYRQYFHEDFLIDLIGYRRYGHNEGDEPTFTQPKMYALIREHPTARQIWAAALVQRGVVEPDLPAALVSQTMQTLQEANDRLKAEEALVEEIPEPPPPGAARRAETAVSLKRLRAVNQALLELPEGFHLNRKVERALNQRRQAFEQPDKPTIDWATGEILALGTILEDGVPIRFTGEDVIRGTFSQRHAAFYDVETEQPYFPLHTLPQAKASFEIVNSPLSENGAIGFEFGYSIQAPERLVIWEAQYGDFINVAQPVLDEFLISARAKWAQTPSLVLLLPHGNEGQGPDHSSARPERFLQLAESINLRLAYPTTAAQYFHLLRRQAALLRADPLPLVVLTPKGLLRNPQVASRPVDLAEGGWQPVIDDLQVEGEREKIRAALLCSGRVYYDLLGSELHAAHEEIAIIRLEQLHPFPEDELRQVLEGYPNLEAVRWVQEEPCNMGAWEFIRHCLEEITHGRYLLDPVTRPPSSSPAEGSANWYKLNQAELIRQAYGFELPVLSRSNPLKMRKD